jgi:ABC-type transport system involved in cytochrome c biogenesis permease subunit
MKRLAPWLISLVCLLWVFGRMLPAKPAPGLDLESFSRLPVLVDGRVMPVDTLGRLSLSSMNHHGRYETPDGDKAIGSPTQWILEAWMRPEHADAAKLFEITEARSPDLFGLFGWKDVSATHFSFNDLKPVFSKIEEQARLASQSPPESRNAFQRDILKLKDALLFYLRLKNTVQVEDSPDFGRELNAFQNLIKPGLQAIRDRDAGKPYNAADFEHILLLTKRYQNVFQAKYVLAFPDANATGANDRWQSLGEALLFAIGSGQVGYPVKAYATMVSAYRNNDVSAFNQALHDYAQYLEKTVPTDLVRPKLETAFNHAAPFLQAMVLYLVVFLLVIFSWLFWPKTFSKTAVILLVLAFIIHTGGLITRMYLQGRPPVTNLYSSAIFIGWAAVLLCLLLERFYRNGIGSLCASTIGFLTLLIAYNLQLDGDTLEMLRAVLDTNVWLATHVVTVTLGYSGTFLAGLLGIIYIFRGLFTRSFDENTAKSLSRMIYGVVCFAALFSLVGTILGGLWADQSWGRFWGWDPKENGALGIVIWNAIILHARWGGYVRERGIALLAVFGNIVTSLSWFGVNMLGVGLHSYGFMDHAFGVLLSFIVSQLVIIGLGWIPVRHWRGIKARKRPVQPAAQPAAV